MIHIKYGDKQPRKKWLEKAQKLTDQLDAAVSKEERDKIIDAITPSLGRVEEMVTKAFTGEMLVFGSKRYILSLGRRTFPS